MVFVERGGEDGDEEVGGWGSGRERSRRNGGHGCGLTSSKNETRMLL